MEKPRQRILLGHLGARGDCLYATTVARQIKNDFPRCHLTWAIGSMCRTVLDGNPHVDQVWEIPMASHVEMADAWRAFHREAVQRKVAGEFDEIFFTQIYPDNFGKFDGTVRASIFRGYPKRITVPISPVVRLAAPEIENVRRFAVRHGLVDQPRVLLFEGTASSDQTFIGIDFARDAAERIIAEVPDSRVVISSHLSVNSTDARIVDGSVLTFRENAELSKYCSLLIGCSSGVSWLCTSEWAKRLPTIQLLSRNTSAYASMTHDHEYFGLNADHIIEMTDCSVDHLVKCVSMIHRDGFAGAKVVYHERILPRFDHYYRVLQELLYRGQYRQIAESVVNAFRRYRLNAALISAVAKLLFTNWRIVVSRLLGRASRQPGFRVECRKDKENS